MTIQEIKNNLFSLIKNGQTENAVQALTLFGFPKDQIDTTIKEVQDQIKVEKLDAERKDFVDKTFGEIKTNLPNVDTLITDTSFISLTNDLTELPRFEIFMSKAITKEEGKPDVVTYSWSTVSKFSTSSKPNKTDGDTTPRGSGSADWFENVDKPDWKAPLVYAGQEVKSWIQLARLLCPDEIKSIDPKGFNARRWLNSKREKGEVSW